MDKETILQLEKEILQGDATAMVKMSKYLLSGGQHPFFDARLLLEFAKEAGSKEAAMLLKLVNWDHLTSKNRKDLSIHDAKEKLESDTIEKTISDDCESDDDILSDTEIEEVEDDKLDVLLRAQAVYRDWRNSYYMTGKDPIEREEAIHLFEEAVAEYENGTRKMDEDLLEGLVLIAQFYSESDNTEKYLKYVEIGADNGQPTLAYMFGQHLRKTNHIDEAVIYYRKALEGKFTKIRARQALAMIYIDTPVLFHDHKKEALIYINEGIEMLKNNQTVSPEYYIFFLLKGDYWRLCRDYPRACEQYKVALDVLLKVGAPKELAAIAAENLAELFAKTGNSKEANKYSLKKRKILAQL